MSPGAQQFRLQARSLVCVPDRCPGEEQVARTGPRKSAANSLVWFQEQVDGKLPVTPRRNDVKILPAHPHALHDAVAMASSLTNGVASWVSTGFQHATESTDKLD